MANRVQEGGSPFQISATAQLCKGNGTLISVIVGTTSSGTFQFFDTNSGQTTNPITPVMTIPAGGSIQPFLDFVQGLYVVVGGTITAAASVAMG